MARSRSLCQLQPGEGGIIRSLSVPGSAGIRLTELGLRPGSEIVCLRRAPAGDPTAYGVHGMVIALRRQEAQRIWMEGGQ